MVFSKRWLSLSALCNAIFDIFARGDLCFCSCDYVYVWLCDNACREVEGDHETCVCGVGDNCFVLFVYAESAGIMAALGPTTDAYGDGIAKALNHLSLGAVDLRNNENGVGNVRVVEDEAENNEPVENSVENFEEDRGKEAVFDGYVAESTDTRVKLTESAIKVWSGDFKTAVFGVGIGGAGWALYENGLSSSPKEIVQNEYASLLLETGAAGMILLILTLVLVVWVMMKNSASGMLLALLMAYGVTLLFFSGLPNALQIYLLPMVIMIAVGGERLRKAR